MPVSTINRGDDHDSIFYLFCARGSLRYGEALEGEAKQIHPHVGADAMYRHAIDYFRGADQMCQLFDNTYEKSPNPLAHWPCEPQHLAHDADMVEFLEEFRLVGLAALSAIQRCLKARSRIGEGIMVKGVSYDQFQAESNTRYTALQIKTQNVSFWAGLS